MYERFCELLKMQGMKAADVTRATGISSTVFSEWKSGKAQPKLDKLIKIARCLNTSVEYLYTGENEPAAVPRITDFEFEIIKKFRISDSQDAVLKLLDLERPEERKKEA